LPKQMVQHGLRDEEIQISDQVLVDIVRYYTRESGVRNMERELAKICRKAVKKLALGKKLSKVSVSARNLESYLGVRQFRYGLAEESNAVGQVTGLAWTQVGGELLQIEAMLVPGKGKLELTGQLGDVMKESIQAAMTVVRSKAESFGIEPEFYHKFDTHVHVPEGATPKDGPSAGVGMCTALVSALTKIPVRATVAMTGEITLRGTVLPIGGLKEKLLAAHRGGIETVIIPAENEKDLADIPKNILRKLKIHPVSAIDEVLKIALVEMPTPAQGTLDTKASLAEVVEKESRPH
jgi:ATP-dependent Lon protease